MTFLYWPDDKNMEFIRLLREAPILWNRNIPQYSNRQLRNALWSKISKEIGEPNIQLLKTKVKSFRSNYRAECKKIERDPTYRPVWRFYKQLKFLDNLPVDDAESDDETGNHGKQITFHRWSDEKTRKFIKLYKKEPVLWNREHPENTNLREREISMSNIAAKLKCSITVLKIKMKSVRSNYCAERKKMIADENYKPVWRFFQELTFLDNFDGANDNFNSNDVIDDDDDDNNIAYDEHTTHGATYYQVNTNKTYWSEVKTLEFIELLKVAPQLWDQNNPDNENKKQKNIIFQNMAKELKMSVEAVECKYKSVRHQFRRNYLKTLRDKNFVPTWRYFNKLDFMASEVNVTDELATSVEYLENEFLDDNTQSSYLDDGAVCEKENLDEVTINCIDVNAVDDGNDSTDGNSENKAQNSKLNAKTNLVCWCDETTIKFINLLREQPILWDKESQFYGNISKRAECFKQLALEMGSTLAVVKGKYKRLLGEFRTEHRKMLQSSDYKPIWKFFSYLKFIAGNTLPEYESDGSNQEQVSNRIVRHWDDEKTVKFFNLLKQNPILYDKNAVHKDAPQKSITWQNIADELNESVDLVRGQYKRLRQKCLHECLRKQQNPNYLSTWRFLPFTKFLCKAINGCEEEHASDFREDENEQNFSQSNRWSDEQVIDFINVFKKYPIIWDKTTTNFKSKSARRVIWRKMSKEMGIPVDILKVKYKTMRGQYNEESRKLTFDANYIPVWRFYDFLKFIPIEQKEPTLDSFHVDSNNELPMLNNDYDGLEETVAWSIIDYDSGNEHSNDLLLDATTNNEKEALDVSMGDESVSAAAIQRQREHIQDEYTAFADYIANEMRKMKSHRLVELSFKSKVIRAVLEANEEIRKGS